MCVCYTREHGEKRGIHVGVYLSFGQIQPGAAALARTLHQTPAAPVPPARHTRTVPTQRSGRAHTTKIYYLHIHTYLSRCVCLSLPTVLGPPRAGISYSFPQAHTHACTHCSFRGGLSVGWVCEARALITCSSESLGLTLWPCPSLGAPFAFLSASRSRTICGHAWTPRPYRHDPYTAIFPAVAWPNRSPSQCRPSHSGRHG